MEPLNPGVVCRCFKKVGTASGSTQMDVNVSSDTDTAHTSPSTTKEWDAFATQAVMGWMMDHAIELQIDMIMSLEDWGDIPDGLDVMPRVSMEETYDAVA
eukprot:scaffold9650_cov50-Cyclotella_meneghiniana.AAC.2